MLVTRVWKKQPGRYFCISTKSINKKWKDTFFTRGEFDKVDDFIRENADKDVYWCLHGFKKPRRVKQYAEIPRLLWADLDEVDPREIDEDLMPTVAWETSPGRFAALWELDDYMTEELNRRLTYELDADRGGWDITQVLRVPGTRNHKYSNHPRVRLLWPDGPTHKFTEIDKLIGEHKSRVSSEVRSDAKEIYRKYERKFNSWVRRELLRGKPTPGKRSQVFWRLSNELIEAGCTLDEAFELLRISPWNKFRNRRDADDQLRRELEKSLQQHFRVVDDEDESSDDDEDLDDDSEERNGYKFLARTMDDIEESEIDWIWYPYLARGEVSIVEGDPSTGKSYLCYMIAKCIADGKGLPAYKGRRQIRPSKVAYFDVENSFEHVAKKRLRLNGLKNGKNLFVEDTFFTVDDDDMLEQAEEAIERIRPALVVFDTLNTYIGGADIHKSSEAAQAFSTFVEIARRFNCAVMVIRHWTKSKSTENALYRGQGSISIAGSARLVMAVGKSPLEEDDDDVRVFVQIKNNIGRVAPGLTFEIEEMPDTLKEQDRSKFSWGDFVQVYGDDLTVTKAKKTGNLINDTIKFLEDLLEDGPMRRDDILGAGETKGYTERTLDRAARRMGIRSKRKGVGKRVVVTWSLPTDK